MKNNFTKIMNENLNEWNDPSKYFQYYSDMYGYKKYNPNKKDEEKKDETKKEEETKEELKAKTDTEKEEKIEAEMKAYRDKIEEIQDDYNTQARKIEDKLDSIDSEETMVIAKDNDEKKLSALREKKKKYEKELDTLRKKYNGKIKLANGHLSSEVRRRLKDEEEFISEIDIFDESMKYNPVLSVIEEDLIFGSLLEKIEDVSFLEMTDPVSGESDAMDIAKQKEENKAQALEVRAQETLTTNISKKDPATIRSQKGTVGSTKIGTTRARIAGLREDLDALENTLEKNQASLNAAKERAMESFEKRQDALNKKKEQLKATKEKVSSTQNGESATANELTNSQPVNEAMGFVDGDSKDRIDFNNFSKILFDGGSGNALRYAIKGEINNVNSKDVDIVKFMEKKPEVQEVIKKLRFYLRKTASGLSYEEYIDLKVLKGKFRTLYGQAKKEYDERWRNK